VTDNKTVVTVPLFEQQKLSKGEGGNHKWHNGINRMQTDLVVCLGQAIVHP
jgi:hypothetical protein